MDSKVLKRLRTFLRFHNCYACGYYDEGQKKNNCCTEKDRKDCEVMFFIKEINKILNWKREVK